MKNSRVRLAFFFAPLGPAVYLIAVSLLSTDTTPNSLIVPLVFAIPVSYLACLAFGIPLLKVLRSYNALSAITVVVIGSLFGVVVNYLFQQLLTVLLDSHGSDTPAARTVFWGLLLGAMVAVPFVLIAGISLLPEKRESA